MCSDIMYSSICRVQLVELLMKRPKNGNCIWTFLHPFAKKIKEHIVETRRLLWRHIIYELTFADRSRTPSCGSGASPPGGLRSSRPGLLSTAWGCWDEPRGTSLLLSTSLCGDRKTSRWSRTSSFWGIHRMHPADQRVAAASGNTMIVGNISSRCFAYLQKMAQLLLLLLITELIYQTWTTGCLNHVWYPVCSTS